MWAKIAMLLTTLSLGVAPLPQPKYMGNKIVIVKFVDDANTKKNCGVASEGHIVACSGIGQDWMILPNACQFKDDPYARVVCHELGHSNGWPANHPNPLVEQSDSQTHP